MSIVDINIYKQQYHEWTEYSRERNNFNILLKYGLTSNKFQLLKNKLYKSNSNVKNLVDEWRDFFNSPKYRATINNIINPANQKKN